jgi:carboxypeptidase D
MGHYSRCTRGEHMTLTIATTHLTIPCRHIEVSPEHNGHLFFWLFHNRHIGDRQRTVIWLNGGPGCSSMDGALMEVGPYRVKGDKLEHNEGSWDEFTNLLFVDNPVGTGFSYVNTDSYLHELSEMSAQFMIFLEKFFDLFPEYSSDDLYFAGESYAGQHIPYISQAILDHNKAAVANSQKPWNLKGMLIGNGWIAPNEQYQSYLPFAYNKTIVTPDSEAAKRIEHQHNKCLAELSKPAGKEKVDIFTCEQVLQDILKESVKDNKCVNMYDVRLTDSYPSCGMNWPPDLTDVTPYLRRQDVITALHVNPDKRTGWTECTGAVSSAFRASHSTPSIDLLPGLLEAGIPTLLFSGAEDLICNHLGTEAFLANMAWSGGTGMELSPGVLAPKRKWDFEGKAAGIYQEARNLTYVLFYDSSHMVPFDLPRRSRDMLDRFVGVDIASIGGTPVDSKIDGEKAGSETSVGGHTNSTAALEEQEAKLEEERYKAYYRSGEAALVVVLIAAAVFGWWVWRGRRRAANKGYAAVPLVGGYRDANGATNGNGKGHGTRDLEAGDFDENELDDLTSSRDGVSRRDMADQGDLGRDRYDIGSDSDEEEDEADVGDKGRSRGKQGS